MGSGAGISGSFSSNAARQQAIETAKSIAKTKGYTESIDKVLSAVKSVSEGNNDTKGASLADGAMASLNEARHMRDEATIAHSKVDEISNSFSSSQSTGLQERRNTTQEIQDYIAAQPASTAPDGHSGGKIGAERAFAIQRQRGEEYLAYKEAFYAENLQYSVAGLNVANEQAKLESQFNKGAAHLRATNDVNDHYSNSKANVISQGANAKLDLNAPPPTANAEVSNSMNWKPGTRPLEGWTKQKDQEGSSDSLPPSYNSLQDEIGGRIAQTDKTIKEGLDDINEKNKPLTKALKTAENQTLGGTAVENLGKSFKKGVKNAEEGQKFLPGKLLVP